MRNALARRLQRNISETSQVSKTSAPAVSGNLKLPPNSSVPVTATGSAAETFDAMSVRVSGYLNKYSSGHLARWQKRFFVLEGGKLSYFKKSPSDKDTANKVFSIRKIKSVTHTETGEVDDREFKLVFVNGKTYQMRAPTHEDMQKWVASLRGAIQYYEQSGLEVEIPLEEGDQLSDCDGMTSAQGSVMSENRPPESPTHSSDHKHSSRFHGLIPRRESLSGVIHAAGHGLSSLKHAVIPSSTPAAPDTSMLEVEIDPDQLDKNFEEWFYFVPGKEVSNVHIHRDIKMSHITDACSKANQHLWSTLANLPRGSEVKLEEAVGRARARMGAPEAVERAAIIIEEYLSRLSKNLLKSVDMRSAALHSGPRLGHGKTTLGLGPSGASDATPQGLVSELPQLIDAMIRISLLIEKLLVNNTNKCLCCYCDPSGVAMLKMERQQGGKKNMPPNACSQDKWKKCMRGILQRLGGEIEVGLIEELQNLIQSAELAWESPARLNLPTDESVFGPCPQQHPLLDDMFVNPTPGVKMAPRKILMSSFGPAFVQSAQSRCLNAASQWMAAYPNSARLISEHASSALVASLNCVWRQFKRVAAMASERAEKEGHKKYTESMRNSREDALRSSASSNASSPRGNRRGSRASSIGGVHSDALFDLEHLASFANECVLISRFCAKTWSNGVSAKFTPDVFLTCMDSLSSGLLATAADVCNSIVCIHYAPRVKFDMNKMFHVKNLAHSHTTPMKHGKIITEQFVASVDVLFPLSCVKEGVIALLGPALMRAYMGSLFHNKPKLKTFKTVPEMVKGDVETFKELFSGTFKVGGQTEATLIVVEELVKVLNERNRFNYSIHFNTLSKLIHSRSNAFNVINSVVKMREHEWKSSSDKKDIANMLSHIKAELQGPKHEDNEDAPHKDESVVRKGPKGTVTVVLGVGDLKVKWLFDE